MQILLAHPEAVCVGRGGYVQQRELGCQVLVGDGPEMLEQVRYDDVDDGAGYSVLPALRHAGWEHACHGFDGGGQRLTRCLVHAEPSAVPTPA